MNGIDTAKLKFPKEGLIRENKSRTVELLNISRTVRCGSGVRLTSIN